MRLASISPARLFAFFANAEFAVTPRTTLTGLPEAATDTPIQIDGNGREEPCDTSRG